MAAQMWPTPTSTERSGINPNTGKGGGLSKKAQDWPTPRAAKGMNDTMESALNRKDGYHGNLEEAVARTWPTPTGDDANNVNPKPNRRYRTQKMMEVLVSTRDIPFR